MTTLLTLLLCMLLQASHGSRILIHPYPYFSHVEELLAIGSGLYDKGHELHIILPPSYPWMEGINQTKYKVIEYKMKEPDVFSLPSENKEAVRKMMYEMTPVQEYRENGDMVRQFCHNHLSDDNLYRTLKELKFDLAILDNCPSSRCNIVLLYRLGIPYVSRTSTIDPWLIRSPALPSFVPWPMAWPMFLFDSSRRMTFWQRLMNTWSLMDWTYDPRMLSTDDSLVSKYAPEMPYVSMDELSGRSLLWLIITDFTIDYPRPLMPNEVNIGGLRTHPAKPVPDDMEQFLSSSHKDAVLVSFGSTDWLTEEMYSRFMEAFSQMDDVLIVWRYIFDFPEDVPKHIKLLKWIPQNDLLAHDKIKLFITHGGANGQYEAIYHGVPMITFPIATDQHYNAMRALDAGISITMKLKTFTPCDLVSNIRKVIPSNSTYAKNIAKRSQVFHDQDMAPQQRAVYWVEHVLKYGGEHLRCSALDLPWYQYFMLDVILFLVSAWSTAAYIFYKISTLLMKSIVGVVSNGNMNKKKVC